MPVLESIKEKLAFMRLLSPKNLRKLADQRLSDLVLSELSRSRRRVDELASTYPSAQKRELAQRLVDGKKTLAGMVGGVSGVFGVASVPVDLLLMVWLQVVLLADIATLYKENLKSESARKELLDLFGYANGIGPMQRASPKVLGKVASLVLAKGGFATLGKAVPLVAAPISAYLNNQHIQRVGEEAVRHYEGFGKAQEKSRGVRGA